MMGDDTVEKPLCTNEHNAGYVDTMPLMDEIQQDIVDEFLVIDDPLLGYELLLQYAASLPKMDARTKEAAVPVEGCQSKVWLKLDRKDGCLSIQAESDTLIIRGILYLLLKVLDGQPCAKVAECDLFFLEKADLLATFDDSRIAGIGSIVSKIKGFCM